MSPITKAKLLSAGDISQVFELLHLSSDEERDAYRSLGRTTKKRDPKIVCVTRLSNGTDPIRTED
jgi:hypothetical protein